MGRRVIVPSRILVLLAVAFTGLLASVPASAHQVAICSTSIGPVDFSGAKRPNGDYYGYISWSAKADCIFDVVFMSATADLVKVKVPSQRFVGGVAGRCGIDAPAPHPTPGCSSVVMPTRYHYCDPCNGVWTFHGRFVIRSAGAIFPIVLEQQGCVPGLGGRVVCSRYYTQVPIILTKNIQYG